MQVKYSFFSDKYIYLFEYIYNSYIVPMQIKILIIQI